MAIENRGKCAGFIAMQQVSAVTHETVAKFVQCHLPPSQLVRSDALTSLAEIGKTQHHTARVTPPDRAGKWLPWVHIAIGNLKAFLLGTYHGVLSRYMQKSISMSSAIGSTGVCGRSSYRYAFSMLAWRILRSNWKWYEAYIIKRRRNSLNIRK